MSHQLDLIAANTNYADWTRTILRQAIPSFEALPTNMHVGIKYGLHERQYRAEALRLDFVDCRGEMQSRRVKITKGRLINLDAVREAYLSIMAEYEANERECQHIYGGKSQDFDPLAAVKQTWASLGYAVEDSSQQVCESSNGSFYCWQLTSNADRGCINLQLKYLEPKLADEIIRFVKSQPKS